MTQRRGRVDCRGWFPYPGSISRRRTLPVWHLYLHSNFLVLNACGCCLNRRAGPHIACAHTPAGPMAFE
eukprot:3874144-Prymnesium_polylepis.1